MTIKERIQRLLKEKGVPAVQMENDLGFARGYISKLDKASPTADKLLKIADYLQVTTDQVLKDPAPVVDLLIGDEFIEKLPARDTMSRELVRYFELLPEDLRQNVLDFVKATAKGYGDKHDS